MSISTPLNSRWMIVLIGVALLLLFAVFFVLIPRLYARCFWYLRGEETSTTTTATTTTRRNRFELALVDLERSLRSGLDPSLRKSIPMVIYNAQEYEQGLECAICLSDIEEGEKARLLPKCNHGFHSDCIDMWFKSHSSCPMCRPKCNHGFHSDCIDMWFKSHSSCPMCRKPVSAQS